MEDKNGKDNPQNNQPDGQEPEIVDVSKETDTTALQEKVNDLSEKNKQLFVRAKQAEGFEFNDGTKRWEKKEKPPAKEPIVEVAPQAKTGDSDIESLVLEVKGITADDEIELFGKWKKDTQRDTRSILNNGIFQSELKALRDKKAQEEATPSSRRTSQAGEERIDLLVAEYERTKKLPDDFDLRAKVIDVVAEKHSTNTPPWRKQEKSETRLIISKR